jgi:F-type H+-transporting ATPase subunit a
MATPHISLAAEPIFHLGEFAITNAMLTSVIGSTLIIVIFSLAARSISVYPRGRFSQVVEAGVEVILELIERIMHSREKAVRFFPLLMTFFVFILINNWLGLLPGVGSIMVGKVPLFRGATADLNTTIALALISVILTQLYAIKELGLFKHLSKYFSLNPIQLFVGLLELFSEISRMISFAFRLFGNVFAGEVLLVVLSFLIPLVGPLPFYFLELFVGFIQALVFTMLTVVFIQIATTHHESSSDQVPVLKEENG